MTEGEPAQEFQKITTWKTRVTSLTQTDNESSGPPLEVVGFSFDKIELIYRIFDEQGALRGTNGSPGTSSMTNRSPRVPRATSASA